MNLFWKIIFVVAFLIAIWFVGKSTFGLWRYFSLNAEAPATIEKWEIVQFSSSKFGYEVNYYFKIGSRRYEKKELLAYPVYPNKYAAEGEIKNLEKDKWTVYYSRARPQVCSLERSFPLKSSFYALLSLGVLLYFFWLYLRYSGGSTGLD